MSIHITTNKKVCPYCGYTGLAMLHNSYTLVTGVVVLLLGCLKCDKVYKLKIT